MPHNSNSVIFHAGLNKAGSSFLQELFPDNFQEHCPVQIFYPKPHLSSGNAGAFSQAVRTLDKTSATRELRKLLDQGEPGETILLSTEFMYHQFVKPDQRDMLHSCFSDCGIEDFTLVFVFRNVFEHAVSAYCHRCGVHAMPCFDEWIVETISNDSDFRGGVTCYEFWTELRLFLIAAMDTRFKLRFLPYSKTLERDFENVLNTQLTQPVKRAVNVSVSPSEAEVLRRLRVAHGKQMHGLRQRFKAIERSDKEDDFTLLNHYHMLINEQLQQHSNLINDAEKALGFGISTPPATLTEDAGYCVKFSGLQLDALVEATTEFARANQKSVKERLSQIIPRPLRPLVRQVYRTFRA